MSSHVPANLRGIMGHLEQLCVVVLNMEPTNVAQWRQWRYEATILKQTTSAGPTSSSALADSWRFLERSFLAHPPVNSICWGEFKCFSDVKGSLERWQLQGPVGHIKAQGQGERWWEGRRGEIRYPHRGVYLSGVMSLAHTDNRVQQSGLRLRGTQTPQDFGEKGLNKRK